MRIKEKYLNLRKSIPPEIQLVVASKGRTPEEIKEVIDGGAVIIGENYVQEAKRKKEILNKFPSKVKWHMIGHLQRNKVKTAVRIFDMIQTVDSVKIGKEIDKQCSKIGKVMPVLIEINIAKEKQKSGIEMEEVIHLIEELKKFRFLKIMGLMTMGPVVEDIEKLRPYFREMKKKFDEIKKLKLERVEMKYLSMGMSSSYQIAIEEGSNMVRIGTLIFGERKY